MIFTGAGQFLFHIGGDKRQGEQLRMHMIKCGAGALTLVFEDQEIAPAVIPTQGAQTLTIGMKNPLELCFIQRRQVGDMSRVFNDDFMDADAG